MDSIERSANSFSGLGLDPLCALGVINEFHAGGMAFARPFAFRIGLPVLAGVTRNQKAINPDVYLPDPAAARGPLPQ
jgi:hypothetical protein